jgi:hypothetical protein
VTEPVRVMVTIDTEEDDWGSYRPRGASVKNIRLLPELMDLWDRFGVRPTYFVNYPPMAVPEASEVLRSLARAGRCEMGVHCHPWNTPPVEEAGEGAATMMSRLPGEVNRAKLAVLTDRFVELFHARPRSFRAGRWGFGPSVARPLHDLGYEADFSVSPFVDWTRIGGPDYTRASQRPYRFDPAEPLVSREGGVLVEVPTSVGFLRGPQRLSARVRGALARSPLARLKVVGLLDSVGLLAQRWISPETSTSREMIRLATSLTRRGLPVLDLTFHSSSLLPGATPFVRTEVDRKQFLVSIESFLAFCSGQGFQYSTASEVAVAVREGELL